MSAVTVGGPVQELIRVATAGSVDDGKSTLIGRLLYDSKSVLTDQLDEAETDLALLTDGLRAEREQGITIDVAHRYFATPARRFVIADTPGHEQYTRNMVTGASTAHLAIILVDARNGLTQQTRRHAFITSLLAVQHVVLCVNKMDLVDWSAQRFDEIREEFRQFATKLELHDLTAIPISALHGDNVVNRSTHMQWYEGPPLLHHLEQVHISSDRNLIDARLPIQYVVRAPQSDFRGVAGTVAGGVFKPGDEVVALPSGFSTTVSAIWGPGGLPLSEAFASSAVCVELADQIDVGRGDMLCRPNNRPLVGANIDAMVCWLSDERTLAPGNKYTLLHANSSVPAEAAALDYRLDVNTLHRDLSSSQLALNEIGRVQLRLRRPIMFDPYRRNRTTGSFVLIDDRTNNTVAAGMVSGPTLTQSRVVWHNTTVSRAERATRGGTVWLTGLSASGKSTIAVELERRLVAQGIPSYRLDGDNLRHGLNADLGFSPDDRAENVRRVGAVAQLLAEAGVVAIAALISPYRADRDRIRRQHAEAGLPFVEVFVDTPVPVCEHRDPKGMYAKARTGEITDFTGVNSPYEPPQDAELVLRPDDGDPAEHALAIMELWLSLPPD
jgi:bifunctional enzyme CysN/CysC